MQKTKRLADLFQPEHYDLNFDISRRDKTIDGVTKITGTARKRDIKLNEKGLKIDSVEMNAVELPFEVCDDEQEFVIHLPKSGKVTLTIKYHAPLTDTMMGIYPSYYRHEGVEKQIVGTQFETTAARQAFPGVDEPKAKATFTLGIKYDEMPGETVIANTPESKTEHGVHYFEPTKKMSTYLVAVAFGDLQSKKTKTNSGVEIGVFATKAHKPQELDFALQIAKEAIDFYEKFYQTPYPLPHSWQLALPDFSAGAMENWGLVTYREAYMLIDPDNSSLSDRQLVATVITHELAHQWFGDLVTMNWWDDLWLNESFANMMEYLSVGKLHPDWNIWELFQTSEVPMALERDAVDGVQPVHVDVNDPAEIDALFDGAIVYAKGARMLVMVRSLIGDDALRAGLKKYFEAHQYGNAAGDDLWKALEDASGFPIGKIMKTWLDQPGYPVVHAFVNDDGDLELSQKQFFIGQGHDEGRKWDIPLAANYAEAPTIMDKRSIKLGNYNKLRKENGKPFKLNEGNNSHFIVDYSPELRKDILANADELDDVSKRQLLQDNRLLAKGQQASYADLVTLMLKFADSESAMVNSEIYQSANDLKMFVEPGSKEDKQLHHLLDVLSAKQVERLGWQPQEGESNQDTLSRPYVLSASLYAKNPTTIKEAHQLFNKYAGNVGKLPADVRGLVLKSEVQNYGTPELSDKLLKLYETTPDASLKSDLELAVTSTEDQAAIEKLLKAFKDSSVIKPQDLRLWYGSLLRNPKAQEAAWNWLKDNWEWLNEKVGGDMEFATFVTVTAQIFHTPEQLKQFKEFFEPKINTPGLIREIKMDTDLISSKVDLVENKKDVVTKKLNEI